MEKGRWFKLILLILGSGLAIFLPVYFTRHPYSPKSFIPLLLGIVGSSMMVCGVLFYALRKRVKVLKNLGRMKYWLDAHITFCILGPLLVVYHTAFTIKSPNAAVALYAMLIVVASGIVGRYIYRHFQFSLSGERATLKEMSEEIDQLNQKINQHFSESQKIIGTIRKFFDLREKQKTGGLLRLFYTMLRVDWLERKLRRQINRSLQQKGLRVTLNKLKDQILLETILIKRISLEKKISALEVTTKLFAYWHKLHVPLIWILVFTLIAHITAVLIF